MEPMGLKDIYDAIQNMSDRVHDYWKLIHLMNVLVIGWLLVMRKELPLEIPGQLLGVMGFILYWVFTLGIMSGMNRAYKFMSLANDEMNAANKELTGADLGTKLLKFHWGIKTVICVNIVIALPQAFNPNWQIISISFFGKSNIFFRLTVLLILESCLSYLLVVLIKLVNNIIQIRHILTVLFCIISVSVTFYNVEYILIGSQIKLDYDPEDISFAGYFILFGFFSR